jgi:hypothetical protein
MIWTPVSKAMPPEDEVVLVTLQRQEENGKIIAFVTAGARWEGNWVDLSRGAELLEDNGLKVTAWAEMPDPYIA